MSDQDDHYFPRMSEVRQEMDFQREHIFNAISKLVEGEVKKLKARIEILEGQIKKMEEKYGNSEGDNK